MADTTNVVVAGSENNRSYVDWPAIIAGAVLASAISFILFSFGSALGLGALSPYRGQSTPGLWLALLSAVWVVFVAVSSFMAGGYLTGRLRHRFFDADECESNARDGMHGLIMWGLAVLIGAVLAASSLSSVVQAGATVAGGAARGVATNPQASDSAFDVVTDSLFRPVSTTTTTTSATPSASSTPPMGAATTTETTMSQSRAEARGEVDRLLARGLARGEIVAGDRTYIAMLVVRDTGMPQQEAEKRVNTVLDQTIADAKRAADVARKTAILVACLIATTLMVAGAGAYFAAVRGGDHRDNNRDLGPMWS